jgi:hypothetical protein
MPQTYSTDARYASPATPLLSVVIPAHNEGAVIDRCLRALLAGARDGEIEVIVVANGCLDDTAARAGAWPNVTVVDLGQASKAIALSAGDRAARVFPRVYLDADVEISYRDLFEITDQMEQAHALVGAPRLMWDGSDSSWAVRCYYRVWEQMPYIREGLVGVGVYVLSRQGRDRFEEFPHLLADDLFIKSIYSPEESLSVSTAKVVVHPPRDTRSLIRMLTRQFVGNSEFRKYADESNHVFPARPHGRVSWTARVQSILSQPGIWPAVPVHAVIYALVRIRAGGRTKRGDLRWKRDDSSRRA